MGLLVPEPLDIAGSHPASSPPQGLLRDAGAVQVSSTRASRQRTPLDRSASLHVRGVSQQLLLRELLPRKYLAGWAERYKMKGCLAKVDDPPS